MIDLTTNAVPDINIVQISVKPNLTNFTLIETIGVFTLIDWILIWLKLCRVNAPFYSNWPNPIDQLDRKSWTHFFDGIVIHTYFPPQDLCVCDHHVACVILTINKLSLLVSHRLNINTQDRFCRVKPWLDQLTPLFEILACFHVQLCVWPSDQAGEGLSFFFHIKMNMQFYPPG